MPRISRVRLHNIRYGKERRVLDNLIFDLRGRSSLLILENGGGKTLILQLISQVVCPNAPLGKRRLATLVRNNPFTGHVPGMRPAVLPGTEIVEVVHIAVGAPGVFRKAKSG